MWEYPDGRIEIRANGEVLTCRLYNKLAEVDQGAIIEHKRLSHALQVAEAIQTQRDNRRISGSPSRANRGLPVRAKGSLPGAKKQRAFTEADIEAAILQVASQTHQAESNRRSANARG